ncbi:MAG TPA: ParB/RepB/Spo0J family partition protein [Pseudonocardiaceae bacterium]|jgi:ParB/RepB/Spo0J family partition protein
MDRSPPRGPAPGRRRLVAARRHLEPPPARAGSAGESRRARGARAADRLRFHPNNIRSDLGDLRQLTASIKAHGVLCPLMAHPCGSYLQLLHGHRRLVAARLAGLRSVPVVIVDQHENDEAITLMLAENLARADVSRHDRRAAIRRLLDEHGHTTTGIAARLGVTADTVRRWAADDGHSRPLTAHHRRRRVPGASVLRIVERWTDRAGGGLTADQAAQLFAELAELATP